MSWCPTTTRWKQRRRLYEHLQRCFHYTIDRLGPHGLPLIGRADWNDCLNLNCFSEEPGESFQTTTNREGTVAESVFIAGLFVLAAHELADIADHLKRPDDAQQYRAAAARMDQTVTRHGWDGNWFLRAYDAFGHKIGSQECDEGRIFIESNGMCVMAGLGVEDGRAEKALAAVNEHLATPHGIVLQQPAYSRYYVASGRNLVLSAGLQRKRRYLLPYQSVDHDCRSHRRARRSGT